MEFKSFQGYTVKDEVARDSIEQEKIDRDNAIDKAITQEVENRDNAIAVAKTELSTEFETSLVKEVEDRNKAITQAKSELSATIEESITKEVEDRNKVIDDLSDEFNSSIDDIEDVVKVHFPCKNIENSGDTAIIVTKNEVIMIDCGVENTQDSLINYMLENGIDKIDRFIISHYHSDHIGGNCDGIFTLLDSPLIDTTNTLFYLPHQSLEYSNVTDPESKFVSYRSRESILTNGLTNRGLSFIYPTEDETIIVDNCVLKFMNLSESNFLNYYTYTKNENEVETGTTNYNNFSMVVELTHHNNKMLFTGDIEKPAQSKIADKIGKIDVLKVEHHCLNIKTDTEFLKKLDPKFSIICNYYSELEPKTMTYNRVKNVGSVYSTNGSGNIVVTSHKYDLLCDSDNGSINMGDTYSLLTGNLLDRDIDLDNFFEIGTFFTFDSAHAQTILNAPFMSSGFKLIVESLHSLGSYKQTIILSNSGSGAIFTRCTTGGVYGKWNQITPYTYGVNIESGTNLNDCIEPICYRCGSVTIAKTLLNAPSDISAGFKLVNEYLNSTDLKQIIYPNNTVQKFYMRGYFGGSFTGWSVFTGTAL